MGHLDEAFKSRIHISLYYPPLTESQTVAIFDVNIRQLSRIEDEKQKLMEKEGSTIPKRPKMIIDKKSLVAYGKWHWSAHRPSERWNGRQIRNAFQIAYSLAHWPNKRPTVDKQGRVISQNQLPSAPARRAATPNASTPKPAPSADTVGQVSQQPLKLDYRHFEEVARVIEKFDAYLYDTLAGTSAESARDAGTRADAHDPTAAQYSRYPGPPPPSAYAPSPPQQQQQQPGPVAFRRRQGPTQRFTPGHAGGGAGSGPDVGRSTVSQLPQRPRFQPGAPAPARGGASRQQQQRASPQKRRGGGPGGGSRAREEVEAANWENDSGFYEHGGWDLEPQAGVANGGEEAYGHARDGGGGGDLGAHGGYGFEEHEEGMEDSEQPYDDQGHYAEDYVEGGQQDEDYDQY